MRVPPLVRPTDASSRWDGLTLGIHAGTGWQGVGRQVGLRSPGAHTVVVCEDLGRCLEWTKEINHTSPSLASSGRYKVSSINVFGGSGPDLQASQIPALGEAALGPGLGAPMDPGPLSEGAAPNCSYGFLSPVHPYPFGIAHGAPLALVSHLSFVSSLLRCIILLSYLIKVE